MFSARVAKAAVDLLGCTFSLFQFWSSSFAFFFVAFGEFEHCSVRRLSYLVLMLENAPYFPTVTGEMPLR